MNRPFLLCISGATGTGKTELAIELYLRYGWPIISADSRQVYRYLDIGTNKVSQAIQSKVPHFLLDICTPDESYSAGRFIEDVEKLLNSWRVPIVQVVGGTGFYIHALIYGLDRIPPIPAAVRAEVEEWLKEAGLETLREWLRREDPQTAAQIDLRNPRRVTRAIEVLKATGMPWASFWQKPSERRYPALLVVLTLPREKLYEAIAQRTRFQVAAGWMEETLFVLRKGYSRSAPGLQTLGYKECLEVMDGRRSAASLVEAITTANRQYARRQLTWWRGHPPDLWIEERSLSARLRRILEVVSMQIG